MGMMMYFFYPHLTAILSCIYRFAEENYETDQPDTRTSLATLQNMKDNLQAHMSEHNGLGDANTDAGFYNYWIRLLLSVNVTTSYSCWDNTIKMSIKKY